MPWLISPKLNRKAYYNRNGEIRICWVSYNEVYNYWRLHYGRIGDHTYQTTGKICYSQDDAIQYQEHWLAKHRLPSHEAANIACTNFDIQEEMWRLHHQIAVKRADLYKKRV